MQPKCGQKRKGRRFQSCEPAYIWMRCRTKELKVKRTTRCACPACPTLSRLGRELLGEFYREKFLSSSPCGTSPRSSPLACHPEPIRRGWVKDLNFHMIDQQMSRSRGPAPP